MIAPAMTNQEFGAVLILAGTCVFVFKNWIARKGTEIYNRFNFDVTQKQYAKQVQMVAIALIVLGVIVLW